MGILEKCKRGSSLAGLVQLTTKFTKDPRAGTKARVRAKTPQAGRERSSSRPAGIEGEKRREKEPRGSGFCEEDHRQKKDGRGTKLRGIGIGTPLKHAETQNGAGQEAGRPRFWERHRAICAVQEIADPLGSRVFIDDYYTHTHT